LENHIWPAEAKYVNPDFVRKAIRLACLEMLKSGITSFCDMYFAENAAAEEIEKIGMRAFLGEGLLDFPTPISKNPEEGLRRLSRKQPYSSDSCSPLSLYLLKSAFKES